MVETDSLVPVSSVAVVFIVVGACVLVGVFVMVDACVVVGTSVMAAVVAVTEVVVSVSFPGVFSPRHPAQVAIMPTKSIKTIPLFTQFMRILLSVL